MSTAALYSHVEAVTTVFLLDDHEVIRRGVRDLLESSNFRVVGEASGVKEALPRIASLRPDLVILDVRLADGNGITACREIKTRHPETSCLILTSFSDDDALAGALRAGASGYLLKRTGGRDLVDAVERVASGESLLDPTLTARLMDRIRTGAHADPLSQLSEQEYKVFEFVGQGMSNRQIADSMFLAEKTIKNYVSHMLSKLGMKRRTEAAVFAARLSERRQLLGG